MTFTKGIAKRDEYSIDTVCGFELSAFNNIQKIFSKLFSEQAIVNHSNIKNMCCKIIGQKWYPDTFKAAKCMPTFIPVTWKTGVPENPS